MTSRRQPGGPPSASEAAPRSLCVAVVGLSGTERDKGPTGVGKSCLCNRFVRPRADDYHTDHISVLSQTDFGGRVVNNDHFLYWGEARRPLADATDSAGMPELSVHVVEQTEFIDDSSFQPFRSGKTETYLKRCAALRLCSAEKLMYVCKSQLGIEKEFEQRLMPEGRLNVDGFVCVYDVSHVPGRPADKQAEFAAALLQTLVRTRKPVVLAATKTDEACEMHLREAERLVARKELRGQVPLVETSAHENVNVDLAFLLVAQLVDRGAKGASRWGGRVPSFLEASRARREALDQATDAFQALVRAQVTDPRAQWAGWSQRLLGAPECERFCSLFGRAAARLAFEKHVRRLREEHTARRVRGFLRALPTALAQLLPNRDALGDSDWSTVKEELLRPHADFEQYFVDDGGEWEDRSPVDDQEEEEDGRIPYALLDRPEAEACFQEHRAALETEERRQELRRQFRQLLEETGYVTPGKSLGEVRVLFMGRECYEQLPEADLLEVYEEHQQEMTERARCQFQELLLEHAELFYEFANVGPGSVITQEDIAKITEALQEDSRYKTLDRLDQERMLMLLRHLGFVHGPMREHCPANPHCMDAIIEQLLRAHQGGGGGGAWSPLGGNGRLLQLVVLGSGGAAQQVAQAMREAHGAAFRLDDKGAQYALDFRIVDGDVGLPHNSFRTDLPHGCLCVYSSQQSLEYIRESLEKTLLANLEQDDRLPFHGLPLVIVYAGPADPSLRQEGINRAKSLQCPFVDVGGLDPVRLEQALAALVESIQRRAGRLHIYQSLPPPSEGGASRPDLRLLLCMLCGDPYAPEHVLAPLLAHPGSVATGPHCLSLETFLGSSKRSVQVRLASYHEASAYRDHLLHGFVLVYSAQRRASLATLSAFAKGLAGMPMQIVAVTEAASAASAFFSSELAQQLMRDGNALADQLQAHFATSSTAAPHKGAFYQAFFKEAWERKPQVERAFYRDEDDEDDDDEESPEGGAPPVPSRQESYHLTGGGGQHDGLSGEGLYEQLPSEGGSSSSPPGRGGASLSSDNEAPPENGTDHLVRPSQLRKRRSLQAELYRQQPYPSSDSLESRVPPAPPTLVTFGGGGGGPSPLSAPPPPPLAEAAPRCAPPPRLCTTGRRSQSRDAPPPPSFPTAGLRKSSSLKASYGLGVGRAAPVVPPVAPVPTEEQDATHSDSITDDDDTISSSGLSASCDFLQGVYPPPPEPAPPDFSASARLPKGPSISSGGGVWADPFPYAGRGDEWPAPELYYQRTGSKQAPPLKPKPKQGHHQQQPGKLNLRQFDHLTEAISRLQLSGPGHKPPLALPDEDAPLPQDAVYGGGVERAAHLLPEGKHRVRSLARRHASREHDKAVAAESDSDSEWSSLERHPGRPPGCAPRRPPAPHRRGRHRRHRGGSIPVAPPRIPALPPYPDAPLVSSAAAAKAKLPGMLPTDDSVAYDSATLGELAAGARQLLKDKSTTRKKDERKKAREDEKTEKRRLKEEGPHRSATSDYCSCKTAGFRGAVSRLKCSSYSVEGSRTVQERQKRLTEKKKKKQGSSSSPAGAAPAAALEEFAQSEAVRTPLFVEQCVRFIEQEGLDSEGLYRVPGNRAHVELLLQRLDEGADLAAELGSSELPVNAVATALKDFFSKRLPPLLSHAHMARLTEIAGLSDRSCRLLALRELIKSLPPANFEILKFIFQHFVRVAENCRLNSMDSKNLAICWWPTLLPLEFSDMGVFERVRPHLEDAVQTMIDQFRFLFCDQDEVLSV
ncbi:rho GTPase-activating protein 190 isoform X6 [Dermacentor albipictus]|uniref:rho GTPase-activating protein 190 isoform X6 n=1 Tax=Dermacentor albipictus TaxID=60249 RepID=UPI0031FCC2C4